MAKPFSCALVPCPLSEVMQAMPMTVTMKSSGEPKVSTRDARSGSRPRAQPPR